MLDRTPTEQIWPASPRQKKCGSMPRLACSCPIERAEVCAVASRVEHLLTTIIQREEPELCSHGFSIVEVKELSHMLDALFAALAKGIFACRCAQILTTARCTCFGRRLWSQHKPQSGTCTGGIISPAVLATTPRA